MQKKEEIVKRKETEWYLKKCKGKSVPVVAS